MKNSNVGDGVWMVYGWCMDSVWIVYENHIHNFGLILV